ETLYPALVEYFGESQVIDLVEEHDEGIGIIRELQEALQGSSVPEELKGSVTEKIAPLFVHVSDCEGLTIYMEEMSDETLDKIEDNFETAWEEEVPLLEYDEKIRKPPEENVATF
ncbi:MAG: hemerythrin domain-containing protein, partial [Halobacteria archaeon]|nr:hemerythrin domain-containing protein [Halobacteria archaeon]